MSAQYETLRDSEDFTFGSGEYLGPLLRQQPSLFAQSGSRLSPREEALLLGYADGCPVAQKLTNPSNPDPGRDPESMRYRYGEINYWFRQVVHMAEGLNAELAAQLQEPVARREPNGESFEWASVPSSFYNEMPPMGTLWGYALPRMLIKQLGSSNLPRHETQERLDKGLSVLETAISEARTREDLLALVAEGLTRDDLERNARGGGVDARDILHDALSLGWFKEHHAAAMVDDVKKAMQFKAPKLWAYYSELTDDEKSEAGIITEVAPMRATAGPVSIEGLPAYHNDEFGYTLWEGVVDPANPEGERAIVMHVPAGSMSRVWELLEEGYWESIEVLRGSGSLITSSDNGESWTTAPLNSEHPTADDAEITCGDMFSVVADEAGIVVLSRPSREFAISFERAVTQTPEDELSKRVMQALAQVALSGPTPA